MKYREIAGILKKMGCEEIPRRRGGSHRKWLNKAKGRGTVIPDHGSKDLKIGTVKAIIKQLGLDWHEFMDSK
ncbi:MAG: type II toxin-antitoxin system HicA family toxin [bacterium]|nr:type II toxin-antitoxin system HicA family toxin [bacterium]